MIPTHIKTAPIILIILKLNPKIIASRIAEITISIRKYTDEVTASSILSPLNQSKKAIAVQNIDV